MDAPSPGLAPDFAGYTVLAQVGSGGMGVVYRAQRKFDDLVVAIKVIRPELASDPEIRGRFHREAAAMARLDHPNVVALHDVILDGTIIALVMEWVDGADLGRRLQHSGPVPTAEAVRIIIQGCRGLAAIHRAQLVHRDIKPSNLFIEPDGHVRLGDLGLARPNGPSDESLTATGAVIGTPAYLAPEQAAGGPVDARTDVYAMGATLFAALTGRPPFSGATSYATVARILRDPPPDPAKFLPDLDPAVASVIRTAMARDPRDRFADGAALGSALATTVSAPGRTTAAPRRFLWWIAGSALVIILLTWIYTCLTLAAPDPASSPVPVPAPRPRPPMAVLPPARRPASTSLQPSRPPATAPALQLLPGLPPSARIPPPPVWISATGVDRYGPWADAVIAGQTVRLRQVASRSISIGSPTDEAGRYGNERERRAGIAKPIWLAESETSQALWRAVMGDNPSKHPGDDLPVDSVTWTACEAFCAKVALLVPGCAARLPTESEWEIACRSGMTPPPALAADAAWHRDRGLKPGPTGVNPQNEMGFRDLLGNVWEWCSDAYSDEPGFVRPDPSPTRRVLRGGSWRLQLKELRPALRDGCNPGRTRETIGFRIAIGP